MPNDVLIPPVAPSSTILVVDDSATNLQVLVRTLDGTGHRILAARDGETALDIARRVKPDLMLLDVMMPGMDGFEVCRIIKSDPATRGTAIIFLSARGEVSDKVSGLELGAADYITKPIQGEEVLARVATHLSRQHLERALRDSRDRLDRELASAARMQRLILPATMPQHPAVSFAAYYETSRHAGGDYYDVLPLGDDRFGIMVADVSGHGAPRHGDDSRGVAHLSGRARGSARRPASHQPPLQVPLGHGDVLHRGVRGDRRPARDVSGVVRGSSAPVASAERARGQRGRAGHRHVLAVG
jgi:CheY-like chemotaxis protein